MSATIPGKEMGVCCMRGSACTKVYRTGEHTVVKGCADHLLRKVLRERTCDRNFFGIGTTALDAGSQTAGIAMAVDQVPAAVQEQLPG